MSHVSHVSDLVKEFLVFRGYPTAVKGFEQDAKSNQADAGLRVDKVMDQLLGAVLASDLNSLREQWNLLSSKVFTRLENHMMPTVRQLESSLYRRYLIHAAAQGRAEKVMEFFERMRPHIQGQPDWKDWFILPFVKNVDEEAIFVPFCSRQWQDTLAVSLHNFISICFHSLPMPQLCSYEEEVVKINTLRRENETLRARVAQLAQARDPAPSSPAIPLREELMDDFALIAKESGAVQLTSSSAAGGAESSKGLRNFIRNISTGAASSSTSIGNSGTSVSATEELPVAPARTTSVSVSIPTGLPSGNATADPSAPPAPPQHSASPSHKGGASGAAPPVYSRPVKLSKHPTPPTQTESDSAGAGAGDCRSPFILLSQEEYREHKGGIVSTLFDPSGSLVASSDQDGIVKIWSSTPVVTQASILSKEGVSALCWHGPHLLIGTRGGRIKLHDTKRLMKCEEKGKDKRIVCLSSPLSSTSGQETLPSPSSVSPSTTGSKFVFSMVPNAKPGLHGRLILWDAFSWVQDSDLTWDAPGVVSACTFLPSSPMVLLTGLSDGSIYSLDIRSPPAHGQCPLLLSVPASSALATGMAPSSAGVGDIVTIHVDKKREEHVYGLNGKDGVLTLWDTRRPGLRVWNYPLLPKMVYSGTYSRLFALGKDETAISVHEDGSTVYRILPTGLESVHVLGGHSGSVTTTLDWSVTMNCRTVVTGSRDGRVKVSMLLSP